MMEVFGFTLLRPEWLIAIPILIVLGLNLHHLQSSASDWTRAIDPAILAALKSLGRVEESAAGRLNVWLPILAGSVVALALSGPAHQRSDGAAFRNLDGVVFAVDASAEMVSSGQLESAILAARLVVQAAGSRQTGLVVYGADAYEAAALTTDSGGVGDILTFIDAETLGEETANPDAAISMATAMIAEAQIEFADIVLVTSGSGLSENTRSLVAALPAQQTHLSVLHSGSDEAEVLAALGKGVSASFARPEPLIDVLLSTVAQRLARAGYSVVLWRDYGRYLLLLALLPALMLFRRAL